MTGDPIAFVLCGGNGPPNEFPATVRWPDYVACAMAIGPQIKAAGIKRVLMHNPGGDFFLGWSPNPANIWDEGPIKQAAATGVDVRVMHVNQWNMAEQSKCRFADRTLLRLGHSLLRDYYGVDEVIYYVGAPDQLRNAEFEGPSCVAPFLACGEGASVGFDASAWTTTRWRFGDDVCRFYSWIREQGVKVYVEPRLTKEQVAAGLGHFIDGTVAHADFDTGPHFKPDLSIQPGETIRDVGESKAKLPAGVTPCYRDPNGRNWTK